MLTYVINTSENKTFDSSRLFEVAGYSKIRWLQCALNDMQKCVQYIDEKQNSIIADDFRIAVIVDFYGFDKIHIPYGRRGFANDEGVDMGLYIPYIEAFLLDNLIMKLENNDLYAKDFEIYYVQSEKSERYELFQSAPAQVKQILSGKKDQMRMPTKEELMLIADREIDNKEVEALLKKPHAKKKTTEETELSFEEQQQQEKEAWIQKKVELLLEKRTPEEIALYSSFTLYCTPNISLDFPLVDFPYGALEMSFFEFFDAFRNRAAVKADVRRHYYIVPYGGGPSRAALYTLSLSLHLIHVYEREENTVGEGDMEVEVVDSRMLRDVLEHAWRKINAAKYAAIKNDTQYYLLKENSTIESDAPLLGDPEPSEGILAEMVKLPNKILHTNFSGEKLYSEIRQFADRDAAEVKERYRQEFDSIMSEYLRKRDETREADVEADLAELKNGGFLAMTDQCPSTEQYNHLVEEKKKFISSLFERVLCAERIEVDYEEENKKAEEAYAEYKKAKAMTGRNIIGDIIFLLLSVASVIVPYYALQLNFYSSDTIATSILALIASGVFAGLFVLSLFLRLIPAICKMNVARRILRNAFISCHAKERYSFSSIRRKYENDLVAIEYTRYEIRQLKYLFDENERKEKNVLLHRKMLDNLSDTLGSMLNNLDVEPTLDISESVEGEFDITKSPFSRDNEIYKIFSIEAIEKIFSGKGRELK